MVIKMASNYLSKIKLQYNICLFIFWNMAQICFFPLFVKNLIIFFIYAIKFMLIFIYALGFNGLSAGI